MRGLFVLLLVVIVTVDTVRSQRGPPTRTKKGSRPSRRGDNTDVGMPSGKDVPDGMRFPGGVPPGAAAPPPAAPAQAIAPARVAPPAAPPARAMPAARPAQPILAPAAPPAAPVRAAPPPAMPPTRTKTANGAPRRFNDNTDRGLPSGRDFPDAGFAAPKPAPRAAVPPPAVLTRPAPPPANPGIPPTRTKAGARPFNDNPDWGLPSGRDFPDAGFFPAAPAPAPAQPAQTCQQICSFMGYKPVCGYFGDYDNECWMYCNNDDKQCDGFCPCPAPVVEPIPTSPCQECAFADYDPVCGEEDKYRNECEAKCNGVTKYYSCPPTP